jgi:uncharacterized membrane protein YphA (DoxX/SURF4 family)
VFQVISVLLIFTGILFILFGTAKLQPWAHPANLQKTSTVKLMENSTAFGLTQMGNLSQIRRD